VIDSPGYTVPIIPEITLLQSLRQGLLGRPEVKSIRTWRTTWKTKREGRGGKKFFVLLFCIEKSETTICLFFQPTVEEEAVDTEQ
jgi:hypothetical protein